MNDQDQYGNVYWALLNAAQQPSGQLRQQMSQQGGDLGSGSDKIGATIRDLHLRQIAQEMMMGGM